MRTIVICTISLTCLALGLSREEKTFCQQPPRAESNAHWPQLYLNWTTITDADLANLNPLIYEVGLRGCIVTDAQLAKLETLPLLHELDLSSAKFVTDASVPVLNKLAGLEVLNLRYSLITHNGLATLRLPNLRSLTLSDNANLGREPLELNMPALEHLCLRRLDIADDWLASLSSASIQHLDISETKISDAGLKNVGGLPNLITLNVRKTLVTEAGVQKFKSEHPKIDVIYRLTDVY